MPEIKNRKLSPMQKAKCSAKAGTLCWKCKNLNCSWMRDLVPVKGWTAEKHMFKIDGKKTVASYCVIDCPSFNGSR